jgi:hypothetical protein
VLQRIAAAGLASDTAAVVKPRVRELLRVVPGAELVVPRQAAVGGGAGVLGFGLRLRTYFATRT